MNKKKKYYNIDALWNVKANWLLLLGQRTNGKSYAAKNKIVELCWKNGWQMVYLRRWKDDVKQNLVDDYWHDCNVRKITKNEYDAIRCHAGKLYFVQYEEDGKEVRGPLLGRAIGLNEAERYKSLVFNGEDSDVTYKFILYEEFVIKSGAYLTDEPEVLQQFVSTVARNEEIRVILIGNTLSRVSPYYKQWSLTNLLHQKPGTIDIYHYNNGDNGTIDLAIERCEGGDLSDNKMIFGNSQKSIIVGEWETDKFPRLEKSQDAYEMVYEIKIDCMGFRFVMQLMVDKDNGKKTLFIYPMTKDRYIMRTITDNYSEDMFTTPGFIDNKAEHIMKDLWRNNKVAYSDNLTGTDFRHITQYIKL